MSKKKIKEHEDKRQRSKIGKKREGKKGMTVFKEETESGKERTSGSRIS